MAYKQRPIPFLGEPGTNPDTKPFWDALAEGRFLLPKCKDTGKFFWYPRGISPFTFGPVEWVEASGKGKIYSVSVMQRAEVPYAIAYVTLAEGTTMMTNIVDCDLSTLKVGQEVTLKLVPSEGGPPLPMFTPA